VLIPSYNESKTVGLLVEKVKAKGLNAVVIDDGSVDGTCEIAKRSGAHVVRHQRNQGKGASLKTGFRYILDNDYDAAIIMDGDGQHSPEDLPKFLTEASNPEVDIVVGNRMVACKNMPRIRWLTNKFMSSVISLICQKKMADSQCGFRLIKRKALAALHPSTSNYEIESETIIEANHKGFKIKFVPIQTIYGKQVSRINPLVDTIRSLRLLLKICCPFLFKKK